MNKTDGGWFAFDYWSKETQQRTVEHINFATEYAIANGQNSIDLNQVLNFSKREVAGNFGDGGTTFKGSVGGRKIAMELSLSYGNLNMSITPAVSDQSQGTMFGPMQYLDWYEFRSPNGRLPIMRMYTPSQ